MKPRTLLFTAMLSLLPAITQADFKQSTFTTSTKQQAATDPREISKTQQEQLQQLFKQIDSQMQAAFKGNDKQVDQMRSELKAIETLKAKTDIQKAVAAYQSKHAEFYGTMLKKSGVDLSAVAKRMQAIIPAYIFTAQKNFTITADLPPRAQPADNTPATPQTTTTRLRNFTPSTNKSCSGAGGNNAATSSDSVTTDAFAVGAGSCSSSARLEHVLEVADADLASVSSSHTIHVGATAVGVVGTAVASAYADVDVTMPDEPLTISSINVTTIAPVLWVAHDTKDQSGTSSKTIPTNSGNRTLRYYTHSFAIGALTPTSHADAQIKSISASLSVTR